MATQVSTPVLGTVAPSARNRGAVEEVFIKATRMEALAMGLVYFFSREMVDVELGTGSEIIKWTSGVAVDTLRTGVDIVPIL